MSEEKKPGPGTIAWMDLTVPDADNVRDFYGAVVGWTPSSVPMDGYEDYGMNTPAGDCVAGVCHARGSNTGIPPQWMIYIVVSDIDDAVAKCTAMGGKVVVAPKDMGGSRYCVIRDPAGAACALYQNAP